MRQRRRRGRVFVVSSPSGGGKTTIVERVLRRHPELIRSVSVTTRPQRPGERRGRDYHFVSTAAFGRLRRSGQLVEWARVHGAYYGTPARPLRDALARGRRVIMNIDVQGARQIRRALRKDAVLIFLMPPSMEQLRQRLMRRRTDSPSAIRRRLAAARRELVCAAWYDFRVVNDQLEQAVSDVSAIVTSHGRQRVNERGSVDGTGGD